MGWSAGIAAGIALGATGCANGSSSGGGGGGGPRKVRYFYFGNQSLKQSREAAVAAFNSSHSDVQTSPEFSASADYWNKLATEVSSGDVPDVLATGQPYITEYASRNVLLDLSQVIPDPINVSAINKDLLVPGRVNGKLVALPMAATTNAIAANTDLLKQAKMDIPTGWTYDDFANFAKELTKALPQGTYGAEDQGALSNGFEIFARARGEDVYNAGGLAVSKTTLGDWFSFWDNLRKANGCVPADVSAQYGSYADWPNSPLIRKKSALQLINSNNYIGVQALIPSVLSLNLCPVATKGGKSGQYQFAASYVSIYARTKDKKAAGTFLNWLVNDPASAKILQLASGPPASDTAAQALANASLDEPSKREWDYFKMAGNGHFSPPPEIWPKGASQVNQLFRREYQDISFGRKSVSAAVSDFFSQATSMLQS